MALPDLWPQSSLIGEFDSESTSNGCELRGLWVGRTVVSCDMSQRWEVLVLPELGVKCSSSFMSLGSFAALWLLGSQGSLLSRVPGPCIYSGGSWPYRFCFSFKFGKKWTRGSSVLDRQFNFFSRVLFVECIKIITGGGGQACISWDSREQT